MAAIEFKQLTKTSPLVYGQTYLVCVVHPVHGPAYRLAELETHVQLDTPQDPRSRRYWRGVELPCGSYITHYAELNWPEDLFDFEATVLKFIEQDYSDAEVAMLFKKHIYKLVSEIDVEIESMDSREEVYEHYGGGSAEAGALREILNRIAANQISLGTRERWDLAQAVVKKRFPIFSNITIYPKDEANG